jgi:PilZ domain
VSVTPNPMVVRGSKRVACDWPAQASIAPEQAGAIRFSRVVTGSAGALDVRLSDFSEGGLGLHSMVYFAPGIRLQVCIEGEADPIPVRVQRSLMVDRSPRYYLGTSFVDVGGAGLFERLRVRTKA